jgi:hypothetical protein
VNEDEDRTVRQSLLFFSDVASLIQTHPNFRNSGEGITRTESLASSSSFFQQQNSRPFSLSSSILQYHTFSNNLDEVSPRSSFSDTSSDLTITPLRIQKKARMTPEPSSASKDPFVDSSTGGSNTADNPGNMPQSPVSEGKALLFHTHNFLHPSMALQRCGRAAALRCSDLSPSYLKPAVAAE